MSRTTMHHLIAARMDIKRVERSNAANDECDKALDALALVVGMHAALKYQSAVRLMLQLEREQCDLIDNLKK
jgi:hypothetical protein